MRSISVIVPGRRAWIPPIVIIAALLALAMLLALPPAMAQTAVDYDTDDDGLIEIDFPDKLNAIRYDLDGDGAVDSPGDQTSYDGSFANAAASQCPSPGCRGYELTADLDLSADYPSWTPIGTYRATFDGNGHRISGLTVAVSSGHAGLFTSLLSNLGVIRNVGLVNPSVTSSAASQSAGTLVGSIGVSARVETSYASGGAVTVSGMTARAGGLAGASGGIIRASYAATAVGHTGNPADANLGGLVGRNGGQIRASYAAGQVTASAGANATAGGLIGTSAGSSAATDSYCDATVNPGDCIGAHVTSSNAVAPGYATSQLKRPTGYENIYADWNLDLSNPADGTPDAPWDFGTEGHYPLLKIDQDGDGQATCLEFSGQPCYRELGPPVPPAYHPAHDHPESYYNRRYFMVVSCDVGLTWTDAGVTTATLNFHLGLYTRPVTLTLSLWDGEVFRTLQSQGLPAPQLHRQGRLATVQLTTDPSQTRFRLDSEYGQNLVLGYGDCYTDDPEE